MICRLQCKPCQRFAQYKITFYFVFASNKKSKNDSGFSGKDVLFKSVITIALVMNTQLVLDDGDDVDEDDK